MSKRFRRLRMAAGIVSVVLVIVGIAIVACKQQRSREYTECQNQSHGQKCPDPMPYWIVLLAWPEGVASWAVLFTLGAISWQSYETRRAAGAALKQANHIVSSERAWVSIDTGEIPDDFEPDPSTIQLMDIRPVVENYGKTPARIIRVSLRTHQIPKGDQLPQDPEYKNISEIEIMLPPSIPLQPMGTMISLSDFISFRRGDAVLYVYGFVDYLDLAEQERRSAFCFIYLLGGGFTSMKRGFYIATQVPKIYRRNT